MEAKMAAFIFDECVLGHLQIDAEHASMVDLANRLFAAKDAQNFDEICANLSTLETYARAHFQNEEILLIAVQCPNLQEQYAGHENLSSGLARAIQTAHTDPLKAATDACALLAVWLPHHINVVDRESVLFLKSMEHDVAAEVCSGAGGALYAHRPLFTAEHGDPSPKPVC